MEATRTLLEVKQSYGGRWNTHLKEKYRTKTRQLIDFQIDKHTSEYLSRTWLLWLSFERTRKYEMSSEKRKKESNAMIPPPPGQIFHQVSSSTSLGTIILPPDEFFHRLQVSYFTVSRSDDSSSSDRLFHLLHLRSLKLRSYEREMHTN